jgi:hypothetical protein
VCDANKKFIAIHAGLPGSCHDSYVFQRMKISQDPAQYFDENQYLLADSAYANGKYIIPAFCTSQLETSEKTQFNCYLAQSRVRIEHAIDILKGHWASLREMRNQLQNENDIKFFICWFICCVLLHNLIAEIKDEWEELFNEHSPEPPIPITSSDITSNGMRETILPITLSLFESKC